MMRWLSLNKLGWALGLTMSISVVNTSVAQRVCGLPAAATCGHAHAACGAGLEGIPVDANTHIGPPDWYTPDAPRDANVIVNYNGFPEEAMLAFDYAVDIWSVLLTSDVTVRIDAYWTDLGSGALAQAGPSNLHQNFANAPISDTYYPAALANALSGEDLSEQSDLECTFNSTANWYLGTDGNTPLGAYDFVTAALHELAHGLGFIGSAYYINGFGFLGTANIPYPYDHFTETQDSIVLLDLPNGSQTLGTALTSDHVYWYGPNGMEGVGGGRPRLFAPEDYQVGSSYSHLNESTYAPGTPNSLMTPGLNTAESNHNPGPALLGMFVDMGWVIGGCQILDVEIGEQGACNTDSDTYTQTLVLTYQAPPATGLIQINGNLFSLGESPQTLVLSNLPSDGQAVHLDIGFTANPECSVFIPEAFTAPVSCYCLTDLSGNGLTEVQDLLLILADFGCLTGCSGDANGDGASNVEDVLAVLSAFGGSCP